LQLVKKNIPYLRKIISQSRNIAQGIYRECCASDSSTYGLLIWAYPELAPIPNTKGNIAAIQNLRRPFECKMELLLAPLQPIHPTIERYCCYSLARYRAQHCLQTIRAPGDKQVASPLTCLSPGT
jgi:hypothetical protein